MIAKGRVANVPTTLDEPEWSGWRRFVPEYGIGGMNILEAAELIALDMWVSGEVPEVGEPDGWDGTEHDPALWAALAETRAAMQERLIAAVDAGRLEPELIRRDLDERVIPTKTIISGQALEGWLFERGYETGDVFADWHDAQDSAAEALCDEAAYLRAEMKMGRRGGWLASRGLSRMKGKAGSLDERADAEALLHGYKALLTENARLQGILQGNAAESTVQPKRPLSTRERNSLLCIIAALADEAKIDVRERGAATQIKALTETAGTPISDDTIRKFLAQIPDAIDLRSA